MSSPLVQSVASSVPFRVRISVHKLIFECPNSPVIQKYLQRLTNATSTTGDEVDPMVEVMIKTSQQATAVLNTS